MAHKIPAWMMTLLRLAATVIVFIVIFRSIDAAALLQQMSRLSPWVLVLAFLLVFFQFLVNVWRWQIVLEALQPPFPGWVALRIMLVAQFFGQMMPSAIGGDVVRLWYTRKEGFPLGVALSSLILERVGGLVTIALMMLVTLPFLTSAVTDPTKRLGLILCMALVLGGFVALFLLEMLPGKFQTFRLIRFATELGRRARTIFVNPKLGYRIILISALGQVALSTAVWLLIRSLGEDTSLLICLLVVPPGLLITALPIAIAGWGVREGVLIVGLGLGGISPETAVAASLVFGLLSVATGLPGAAVWLVLRRRGEIEQPDRHDFPEPESYPEFDGLTKPDPVLLAEKVR